MDTNISLLFPSWVSPHFEIIVSFSKKDVDTLFPQKNRKEKQRRWGMPECGMLSCISVISYRALMWLRRNPHSLQVWMLVGTWDTQIAHCKKKKGPVCFLSQCKKWTLRPHIPNNRRLFFHSLLTKTSTLCLIHELLSNEGQIPGKQELNQIYYLAPIPLLHSTFFTLALISLRAIN